MAIIDIKAFQCNKCGHIWISQTEYYDAKNPPIACASCKSSYWNRDPNIHNKNKK